MKSISTSMEDIREEDRKRFEELCADTSYEQVVQGKLLKKVTKTGDASDKCPANDAEVIVHYHGTLLDGTVFDSSVRRNEPFRFHIGEGAVIRGWDQGVATMCVNEEATFILHPDLAYGTSGSGSIPGKAVLQFDITLLDYAVADHEYPEELSQRLQCAKVR